MVKPSLEPFTVFLDLESGHLDPAGLAVERRLVDMEGMYQQEEVADGDQLVYRVYMVPVPEQNSEISCSTTILEPGLVGEEYFMTKGHFHQVRDRSEVYIGLSGYGLLVMATEDGGDVTQPIERGSMNYVPGGWAHRTVNVGDTPLVFFAAYVGDAGHDYTTIERSGFPVAVLRGEDGPRVVPNPKYRR